MRIAVNALGFTGPDTDTRHYNVQLLRHLAGRYPEHTFMLFSNTPLPGPFPANVPVYVLERKLVHRSPVRSWPGRKVKKALKKNPADVFISLDGTGCLKAGIPQVIGVADIQSLDPGGRWPLNRLMVRRLDKVFREAVAIITTSPALQQEIANRFHVPANKIEVIPFAAPADAMPLSPVEREEAKSSLTGGVEYFHFAGGFDPSQNLLMVLKAFSQFKKWQQSEMKLVITGNTTDDPAGMQEKISTYKFRDDVVIAGHANEIDAQRIMSAAYALVYTPGTSGAGRELIHAMALGTPLITTALPVSVTANDAILHAGGETGIGDAMIRLYKDEALRSNLAQEGLKHAGEYGWDDAARKLWNIIEAAGSRRD